MTYGNSLPTKTGQTYLDTPSALETVAALPVRHTPSSLLGLVVVKNLIAVLIFF